MIRNSNNQHHRYSTKIIAVLKRRNNLREQFLPKDVKEIEDIVRTILFLDKEKESHKHIVGTYGAFMLTIDYQISSFNLKADKLERTKSKDLKSQL